MNGQQLKNSILQLAIQGRLVPQDSSEEPASALLSRIREEKKRLVEEKIIKKEKPLAPIKDEEKPFDIPESWEWVRLGEITSLYIGKTPERGNAAFWSENDYPWISISDMTEYGHIKTTKESISKKAAVSCFKRISHFGSLIMSFKLTVGRTSIIDIDAFHNEAIVTIDRLCDDNNYIRDYLFYLLPLLSNMGDSKDAIKGKTLNSTSLNNLIIPLPPLAEQHRIVGKIEELLPLVEEYDDAQTKLDKLNNELPEKLKNSILQQAIMGRLETRNDKDEPASVLLARIRDEKKRLVEEKKIKKDKTLAPIKDEEKPFEIPESWEWVRLGDICIDFIVPQRDKPTSFGGDIPWCRIEDIEGKFLNGSKSNQLVTETLAKRMNMHLCPIGTVICACSASIGNQAITTVECYTNQTFIGIVCSNGLFNEYLYYYMSSQKDNLKKIGKGTTISYISRKKFEDYLFPLPPLAEQHRIVEKIEELLTMIEKLKLI